MERKQQKKTKHRHRKKNGTSQPKQIPNVENFMNAIKIGNIHEIAKYIKAKGDINIILPDGRTPLRLSLRYGQQDVYDLLVVGGAMEDFDVPENFEMVYNIMRVSGTTEAEIEGYRQRNRESNGISKITEEQFFEAIEKGDERIVGNYIREKGHLNIKNSDGLNPLFVAAKYKRFDIYEMLVLSGTLDNGIDKSIYMF